MVCLYEPNESYSLIEKEILTIDLIDFDVRHLENKEKDREKRLRSLDVAVLSLYIESYKFTHQSLL